MNMNQIINMVIRVIMRKAINSGIKAGMNAASGLGRKSGSDADEGTSKPVSDKRRASRQAGPGSVGPAKQISRLTRRFTRF